MKIEVGKSYKTRDGLKVHIIEEIKSALGRTHLGVVHRNEDTTKNMARSLQYYYADGMVMQTQISHADIIEEWKEPRSGIRYLNVYDGENGENYGYTAYKTKEQADRDDVSDRDGQRIARVRVEWKEGQFDD